MPANTTRCAVMFADICGSSGLYKALGNHVAEQRIAKVLERIVELAEQHGGVLVKTIGDEVMARFDSAEQAARAAQDIQRDRQRGALQLRIGMSFGDLLLKDGDTFGDTVNDAACVARVARAEEIVITDALFQALPEPERGSCQEFDRIALKGDGAKALIFRVRWQPEAEVEAHSATRVMSALDTTSAQNLRSLALDYRGRRILLAPDQMPFNLGRGAQAHLQLEAGLASREHCHLLYRRGKFVLVDHSTNGTYVTPEGQREIYLRREELPLEGQGVISLGSPAGQSEYALHYQCLSREF